MGRKLNVRRKGRGVGVPKTSRSLTIEPTRFGQIDKLAQNASGAVRAKPSAGPHRNQFCCLRQQQRTDAEKRKKQMGLPWDAVLHSTRHTALTEFWSSGRADAFTIQQIAGHASVTTSQRYIHPLPETIQRAVARLEQYRKTEAAAQRPSLSGVPKSVTPATVPEAQVVVVGK